MSSPIAQSFREGQPGSVLFPVLNTLFPLWYWSVFLSFHKVDLLWHCTHTSGSWVLPFLYILLEWSIYMFIYLALIPHTSVQPPQSFCLCGPSCIGVIPMWIFHTVTELESFLALIYIFKGHTFET